MTRSTRLILGVLCSAVALAGAASNASAATALQRECTADVHWDLTLTQATLTHSNFVCYDADAAAQLNGMFPQVDAHATPFVRPDGGTATFAYSPIVGLCLGRLSYDSSNSSGTGLVKNDGNYHTLVEIAYQAKNGAGAATETFAGALQNACSPAFETTRASISFTATP